MQLTSMRGRNVRHVTAESRSMGWFGYFVDTDVYRRALEAVCEPEGEALHLADPAASSGRAAKRERNGKLAFGVARAAFTLRFADNVAR